MSIQTLLVRTPAQHPQESPCGYVLRLSECNGYQSPFAMFALAEIQRHDGFTVQLNMDKLGAILGPNKKHLKSYAAPGGRDHFRIELCGHALTPHELGIVDGQVCPDCIREFGYMPAWADLELVDGCPIHRRKLITLCPQCGRKAGWYRPGLLSCKCGCNWDDAPAEPLEPAHLALLSHVVSKFTAFETTELADMPNAELKALSLLGLLCFAQNLVLFDAGPTGADNRTPAMIASHLLSNWPANLIAAMGDRRMDCRGSESITKGQDGKGAKGMRAMTANITSGADAAILKNSTGMLTLAAAFEKAPALRRVRTMTTKEMSELANSVAPPATSPGKKSVTQGDNLGSREAANLLGVPVSVLMHLRSSRHYVAVNKTSRVVSFHRVDVLHLRNKLLAIGENWDPHKRKGVLVVKLSEVFHRKFKSVAGKGELVAGILNGSVATYGNRGPEVGDLLLSRDEVNSLVNRARATVFDGKLTPTEVARISGCDPLAVPSLLEDGHLTGTRHPAGLRITAESVERFGKVYRPLVTVARTMGTSSHALQLRAIAAGVDLLFVARGTAAVSPQAFVRVPHIPKLSP